MTNKIIKINDAECTFDSSVKMVDNILFELINSNKNKNISLSYDDDESVSAMSEYYFDDITAKTELISLNSSAENAISTDDTVEVYALHSDEIGFNYRGPKVLPINEMPVTICTANTIGSVRSRKLFRILFDSGSSGCWIKRSAIPKEVVPKELKQNKTANTLAGKLSANKMVILRDIRLPEFDKNRRINEQRALVFDNTNCKYDMILGTNFLSKTGIKLDFDTGEMKWYDNVLPMRPRCGLTSMDFDDMVDQYYIQVEDEFFGEDWLNCFATQILDAKYEFTDVTEVVNTMDHLNQKQKDDLLAILKKHQKMFDGTLGVYPHKKFHIEIEPDAKPVFSRPYSIPRIHLQVFKKELDHLVQIGVLVPQQESEWASPTFIIPKKDGRVRWISDLRQLNKVVKRRQYPLPIINDILRKRTGYQYFTKLDISMQYYTFELDKKKSRSMHHHHSIWHV